MRGWLIALSVIGVAGCQQGFVEQEIDGLLMLSTKINTRRNGTARVKVETDVGHTAMLATARVGLGLRTHFRAVNDPLGQPVFRAFDWNDSANTKTNAGFVADVVSFNWPIAPSDPALLAGRYALEFGVIDATNTYVGDPVFLDVLLKEDSDFTQGSLDVSIVYTDGLEDDPDVREAVEEARQVWRQLYGAYGLEVVFDEYTHPGQPELSPPSTGDLTTYLDISEATGLRTVDVVLARRIEADDEIFGIAGDIPGPLVATTRSAVLVSTEASAGRDGFFSPEEVRLLGETMAHEVGHYLGLFHPVEADWSAWDSLDDTPECSSEGECIDLLEENLMFPFPVCGNIRCTPQTVLTEEQTGVAHRYVGVD